MQEADQYCEAKKKEADNYCVIQKEENKKYYAEERQKASDYYFEKMNDVDIECNIKKREAEELIRKTEEYCNNKRNSVKELEQEIKDLKREVDILEKNIFIKYADISIDDKVTSEEYKNELTILQLKEKDLIKSNNALVITSLDRKKVLNNNIKQILRCFNAEIAIILNAVTVKNIDTSRNKIQRSFEILNRIFETDGVALSYDFLDIKFEQLRLIYSYMLKSEEEKETQRVIREKLVEEQKVLKEIEREKTK